MQDCSISCANALEIQQSWVKPSKSAKNYPVFILSNPLTCVWCTDGNRSHPALVPLDPPAVWLLPWRCRLPLVSTFGYSQYIWWRPTKLRQIHNNNNSLLTYLDLVMHIFQWNGSSNGLSPASTLLMLETDYSSFWGSITCLLMYWLLKSPAHQHAWYWLRRTHNM